MNYNTHARDSGITYDQYLALCDDTRHLVSPVATCKLGIDDAPVRVAERPKPPIVNIDTAPNQIDNSAEVEALLADIDQIMAELDAEEAADAPEAEKATVAFAVPEAIVEPVPVVESAPESFAEKSVTADWLLRDIAPGFRGHQALPAPNCGKSYSIEDTERLVRLQVADLEWLYRSGHRVLVDSPKYRDMLTEEQLNAELAEQFAREKWSVEHKVALLYVPEHLQLELAHLRMKTVTDKLRNARKAVAGDRAALALSVGDDKRIDLNEWCGLRLCEELLGAGKPRAIAALYKKMTGRAIDRANVSRKLNSIGERLKRK